MSIAPEHYSLVALLVAGGLVAVLWLRRRLTADSDTHDASPAREARSTSSPADDPDELLRFRVELHEVSRDLKGELDSKIAVLNRLIIMARNESARLEGIVAQARERI
jgi:hypothetical protein